MKAIFKWIRGEAISKSMYGEVYVALNATTGELIAVKQVEVPRMEDNKSDTRQMTVVETSKLEREIVKDLDHQNVVQHLGFEETPGYLSMSVLTPDIINILLTGFVVSLNTSRVVRLPVS